MSALPATRPGIAERIIRARGATPTFGTAAMENDATRYAAFIATHGFPHMGFSLFCRNGQRHGFLYHNLDNLDLFERSHGQYLRFTHRGKAVTMRGRLLHGLFDTAMEHTLQAVYEYNEAHWPMPREQETLIDRVEITSLRETTDLE